MDNPNFPNWPDLSDGNHLACANCETPVSIRFAQPLSEVRHFFSGKEYVALEAVPVILFCPKCGIEQEVPGRGLTIDSEQGVITHLQINKEDVSVEPEEP